jgi:2,3-bisphosphoglycerate-dependent phosphoglycerate mutase
MTASLLLVRHAQSANNSQAEQYRVPDPTITALGEKQSDRLAEAMVAMRPTVLMTSPFLRSIQTAQRTAAMTGLKPIVRQDLFEQGGCYRGYLAQDRHPMPGMNRRQLESLCPGWEIDSRIGESGWNDLDAYEDLESARQRARRIADWYGQSQWVDRDRVAMIIHADFKLRLIEAFLDRDDIEEPFGEVINTSISRLSRHGRRWRLDFWNSHQHLEPELITA